jgi:hypothetical protein
VAACAPTEILLFFAMLFAAFEFVAAARFWNEERLKLDFNFGRWIRDSGNEARSWFACFSFEEPHLPSCRWNEAS